MKHNPPRSRVGKISLALIAIALAAIAGSASAQTAFTAGDLVVSRVGNGTETLGSGGNSVFLDEYTPGGALVQSINVTAAPGNAYVNSGTAASEGALTLSADGQYLTIGGYKATPGQASSVIGATSATVNREIARIDLNGNVDKTTTLSDAFSGNNIRGVTSTDGTTLYAVGANEGIRTAPLGATTSTLVSTTTTNNRVANVFNGNLYYSTSSGTSRGLYAFNGLPTTAGTTATLFVNTGSTSSPYDFVITSDSNTVYVADSSAGIQKYTRPDAVTAFSLAYTFTGATALTGLTMTTNGLGQNVLYSVNPTNVFTVTDTGVAGTVTMTSIPTAIAGTAGTAYRGVEFIPANISPTPELGGGVALLIGFGALGLLVVRRRAGLNEILTQT